MIFLVQQRWCKAVSKNSRPITQAKLVCFSFVASTHCHLVLIIQSCMDTRTLAASIPVTLDFPSMTMQFHQKDNAYPHFGWFPFCAEFFGKRLGNLSGWYSSYLSLARYCNVPLCNFEEDYALYLSDIMFSRLLKQHNHLLWYSESTKPDLGGNEEQRSFIECMSFL